MAIHVEVNDCVDGKKEYFLEERKKLNRLEEGIKWLFDEAARCNHLDKIRVTIDCGDFVEEYTAIPDSNTSMYCDCGSTDHR